MEQEINRVDERGLKQGPYKQYHENGVLACENNYVDGKVSGYAIGWWNNTFIAWEGDYKNTRRHGFGKKYHTSGRIQHEGYYIDGIEEGEYIHDGTITRLES